MLIGRMVSIAEYANSDVWQGCRASADGNEKGFDKAQALKPDRGRAGRKGKHYSVQQFRDTTISSDLRP